MHPPHVQTADHRQVRLIAAVTTAQRQIASTEPSLVFADLLAALLELTESEYGLIGEVLHGEGQQPYLKPPAITNLAWDATSQRFCECDEDAPAGLEFPNLQPLCGTVIVTGEPVLANHPASDPQIGDLSPEHLEAFLGLPLVSGDKLVGVVGLANRPGGYDEQLATFLDPLLVTCATCVRLVCSERARQTAQASLREYKRFFSLSQDLLCTADSSLHFQQLNPAWTATLGWSLDELRARPFTAFIHPDDLERSQQQAEQMLAGDFSMVTNFENRYLRKDGGWTWLSWTATLSEGTFYATARDITTRKAAEDSLLESKARTRAILDSTVDAIITIDAQGLIQDANPATEKIFGYREDELIGQNVSLLVPSPHDVEHDRYIRNYLETGEARVIGIGREATARRKDGSTFPIDLAVGEVREVRRKMFTGIVRDVTEREATLKRLEETMRELRSSHDALLATLNQLQIGILMLDSDGRITFLSQTCSLLEGIETALAPGKHWADVLPVDQASQHAFHEMWGQEEDRRTRLRLNWSAPSGRQYWLEVDIRDDPHDPAMRIAYLYDVSEIHELRAQLANSTHEQFIGNSQPMRNLYVRIHELAQGDWTVLIQGETGVGKELVARAIHAASRRQAGPFLAVNCAGLTDSLLESQLFGHRQGAFTGAVADQQGLFEAAEGGTILLDEIGDISMKLQASLLRVLQEREVLRIGDTRVRKVDVRVLVVTHRDLDQLVAAGAFREDLLYRIRVARVFVPPLRERSEDIPLLVDALLAEQRLSTGRPVLQLEPAALHALQAYPWPGNIRELRSAIEHAVIHSQGSVIGWSDLPPELRGEMKSLSLSKAPTSPTTRPPPQLLALPAPTEAEDDPASAMRTEMLAALDWAEGNRARAARKLGISRATFYRKLRTLGIPTKKT